MLSVERANVSCDGADQYCREFFSKRQRPEDKTNIDASLLAHRDRHRWEV